MKKIYLFLLVIFGYTAFAQQKGISYQAVIINPKAIAAPGYNGTSIPLSNKAICLSFQIVNGTNQVEYQESQSITTDAYGMVNVVIGTGNTGTGLVTSLDAVNWSQGAKKLVVSVNTEGVCSNYTEISNQLLNYTPYSFYAQNADIKDGYVTTSKLADGAVTDPKVAMGINPAKVGLGNVNNTSDANKPVSTETQTALNLKANLASPTFTGTVSGIDKTMVGLGNVDNTTDTNKPISTATQTALDLKANATDVTTSLALKEDVSNKSNAPIGTSTTLYPTQNAVKTYVDSSIADATIVDADTATKGKIKLSGDLAGTADLPTVPGLALKANVADVTTSLALKEEVSNKSNASLGTSTSLYPTQNAVKTYVDTTIATVNANATALQATVTANAITATTAIAAVQADVDANETIATTALATKENATNKSTTTTLGNSDVLFPTQNAVKTYVDSQVATATIADANATTKGKIQLAGDLTGTAAIPVIANNAIVTAKIADASVTDAKIVGVSGSKVNGNISGSAANVTGIIPVSNGGTGAITVAGIKSILGLNTSRIAIGDQAGQTNQSDAIALGIGAGNTDQSGAAIAIGGAAGATNQGNTSVSIGSNAGQASQGAKAVAIGFAAGQNNQGTNSVAIGAFAGNAQAANSIALNATGSLLNPQTSGFYVAPVRNASESNSLFYNTTTKEITYGTAAPTGPLNLATGVTGILPIANGGTGATTLTGLVKGNGTSALTAAVSGTDYQAPITLTTTGSGAATLTGNTLNIPSTTNYTLPTSSASVLGGVKVGTNLSIDGNGILSTTTSPTFTGTVTAPIYASLPQVLTDAATIAWDPANGLNANVTLGGNRTLSFTATPTAGSYGTLVVTQDATGGRTLTLPSTTNKVLGSTSTTTIALSSAANAKDILNFYYDGTNCYWNIGQGYGTAATAAITNLATSVSGTLPVANGGTGAATLTGLIKGNGTGAMTVAVDGTDYLSPTGSAANLTNFPTLNQNTTGNAATATTATSATNVTGTVAVANGGTGATTKTTAFNALSPMTTSGDIIYGGVNGTGTRLSKGSNGSILTMENDLPTWNTSIKATPGSTYNAPVGFSFIGGDWARNTGMFSDNPDAGASATLKFRIATSNSTADPYLEISPSKVSVFPTTASTSKTTGALTVAGGLGVTGDVFATNLNASGTVKAGTVTYPNAHNSTAGQVLTVNAAGTASWETPASSSGTAHYVGEVYGGGIVFYITTGGFHGLIAETINSSGTSPAELLDLASEANQHNTNGGKLYTDWRVPTFTELRLLYAARNTVGLNLGTLTYQSSTLYYSFTYKALNFNNNAQENVNGDWTPRITRYIRSF